MDTETNTFHLPQKFKLKRGNKSLPFPTPNLLTYLHKERVTTSVKDLVTTLDESVDTLKCFFQLIKDIITLSSGSQDKH